MNQKEIIIDELKAMGFEPVELDDIGYRFKYDGVNYLYAPNENDEQFLRIVIPNLQEVTDENRVAVLEAMQETNLMLKYAKVCILYGDSVWAIYEHRFDSTENLTDLMEHIISVLNTTQRVFYKMMNGEEVVGSPKKSDDYSDDAIEAELQKRLDSIGDSEEYN